MLFLPCISSPYCYAQNAADSIVIPIPITDSLIVQNNIPDTLVINIGEGVGDSITPTNKAVTKKKDPIFNAQISRTAQDSVIQDLKANKIYYYGNAVVKYEDIVLEASYMEFDLNKNTVTARGLADSTGRIIGSPVFTQGETKFDAGEMSYNFKTKKGIITKVFTEESGGYLHGATIKRMEDNSINIRSGGYTTCNLKDHPHYQFRFKKAKVIPDDKIVTGPIYMTIEDIPLPLCLPFAMFPNVKGRTSGIIFPTYGESANRGFYLENGGYYWAISPKMDLQIVGDIYSRGSWAIKPKMRYVERYRFNGSLGLSFAVNKIGSKGASDYSESNDFQIRWTHKQDAKAHPRHTFSADVNIISSNYNKYNASNTNEYLSNTFRSSIAYQTNIANKLFFTINGSHNQNTITKQVSITLPEITLSANRIYPLQNVGKPGKKRWYKDLNVNYTLNAKNQLNNVDSLLFAGAWYNNMKNGIKHSIPINLPVKLFKHFTWTSSANFNDYMYFDYQTKSWSNDTLIVNNDTTVGYLRTDTIHRFRNIIDFNLSTNLTTKVYGMMRFKNGPIRAIRHVFTPTVGFTYSPNFGDPKWNIYDTYIDANGQIQEYNMFAGAIFGSPSANRSGRITYNLGNNLEIKVPSKQDTITGLKKIVLLESFSVAGNYDITKDSLNFSYISVNGRTTLFKKLNIQYSSAWDPYATDSLGRRINKFEIIENGRLFHKNSSTWNFGLSWTVNHNDFGKFKERITGKKPSGKRANNNDIENRAKHAMNVTEDELNDIVGNPTNYIDWTTPWSLSFTYNLSYSTSVAYAAMMGISTNTIVQTLGVNGNISITPKWKISFNTGWDFTNKGLSYTSINVYRDLHCWEMRFNWIPIGNYKSWNFTINVKASALQDLKLTKKKDFRDN